MDSWQIPIIAGNDDGIITSVNTHAAKAGLRVGKTIRQYVGIKMAEVLARPGQSLVLKYSKHERLVKAKLIPLRRTDDQQYFGVIMSEELPYTADEMIIKLSQLQATLLTTQDVNGYQDTSLELVSGQLAGLIDTLRYHIPVETKEGWGVPLATVIENIAKDTELPLRRHGIELVVPHNSRRLMAIVDGSLIEYLSRQLLEYMATNFQGVSQIRLSTKKRGSVAHVSMSAVVPSQPLFAEKLGVYRRDDVPVQLRTVARTHGISTWFRHDASRTTYGIAIPLSRQLRLLES